MCRFKSNSNNHDDDDDDEGARKNSRGRLQDTADPLDEGSKNEKDSKNFTKNRHEEDGGKTESTLETYSMQTGNEPNSHEYDEKYAGSRQEDAKKTERRRRTTRKKTSKRQNQGKKKMGRKREADGRTAR